MNKGDLIKELAKVACTKKEAETAVNTILRIRSDFTLREK